MHLCTYGEADRWSQMLVDLGQEVEIGCEGLVNYAVPMQSTSPEKMFSD